MKLGVESSKQIRSRRAAADGAQLMRAALNGRGEANKSVPTHALSMSVRQIMKSKHVVCTVPDARKAEAVRGTVESPVSKAAPASVLQQPARCTLYLDTAAASKLTKRAHG